ncbi:MAG: serine/threonine-protein kinase [Gemmataceae bacterium]
MEKTHLDPTRPAPPRPDGAPVPSSDSPTTPVGSGDPLHDLRHLGEFRILRLLGAGGMGTVYLAFDGRSERQLALKVLSDPMASNQAYIDRFYREAKSGALLNHPNIVRTLNAGQDRQTGKHYLVMEYVDGPSAHALLAQTPRLSVGDAVHIALDVARALEHAHSRNIIHRDIKPDNILITRSGVAKLGDLGLAKRLDDPSHLTAARQGFGTTAYMPYEQAINAKYADGRSDIYALGATLYHLLTGQVPFPGENHLEVVEKKNQGHFRVARSLNPAVSPELEQILARMLARQPRDRYQTASELIIDLERSQLSAPVPSFADPDLARRDPWVQACLRTGEPTRLDPAAPAAADGHTRRPGDDPSPEWVVRYRNRVGKQFTSRLTTDEVVERLQEGTLSLDARIRRADEGEFHPLERYAVFRPYLTADAPVSEPSSPSRRRSPWRTFAALLVLAVSLAGVVVTLIRWLFPV